MTDTIIQERKTTVTVVIGPETEKLIKSLQAAMKKELPGSDWPLTTLVGFALNDAIERWLAHYLPAEARAVNHFD